MIVSVPGFTERLLSETQRIGSNTGAESKETANGIERKSESCETSFTWWKSAERIDPEGLKRPKGEWRQAKAVRAPEIGAGNGYRVMKSPRNRRRNRTERRSPVSNGLAKIFGVESKVQGRSIDLGMARKRCYERAKGRTEFPAPVERNS